MGVTTKQCICQLREPQSFIMFMPDISDVGPPAKGPGLPERIPEAKPPPVKVINEKIKWLEENTDASAEDLKAQKKEMEDIVQPIIAKLYQGQGGAPPPGGEGKKIT